MINFTNEEHIRGLRQRFPFSISGALPSVENIDFPRELSV